MLSRVSFSVITPGADRVHHVNEQDVCIVLSRLPNRLWARLKAVHFNDQAYGARTFGYVTRGRREITLCALPPRIGLTKSLRLGPVPQDFGAIPGKKWPVLAIRRFMLYDVFLHELGHLQVIDAESRSTRLKYARERCAEEFAMEWRHQLWSQQFDHPDPVHNAPAPDELNINQ